MGRVQSAAKNIAFGQVGNLVTQLLNFVLRTIFIAHLGDTLNGVNGLYANILSVLSMAELGIGTAMNYSLYKPVAQGNIALQKGVCRHWHCDCGNRASGFPLSALSGKPAKGRQHEGFDTVLFYLFI